MTFLLLAISWLLLSICHSAKWEYDEPGRNTSHWTQDFTECGSWRQSPIDVPTTAECRNDLLLNWETEPLHFVIRNNGHSLKAIPFVIDHYGGSDITELEVLHHTNDTNIRLTNSFYNTYKYPVNEKYCFDSLHFHWGKTNDYGSEHTLDGKQYPLEVHLVHYSCDYAKTSDALHAYDAGTAKEENVLAVIGILFELDTEPDPVLDKILNDVVVSHDVHKYHDPEDPDHIDNVLELYYTDFDIMDLLPEDKSFTAYLGSLTTPPCFETVRWHVMKNTMKVSQEQLDIFRTILESSDTQDIMAPNWRPLQDIGRRTIYQCQEDVDNAIMDKQDIDTLDDDTHDHTLQHTDNADPTWMIVAMIFIIMFIVSLIFIGWLLLKLREKQTGDEREKDNKKYQKTTSMDLEDMDGDYH